jgi:hypothetical protein
MPISVRIITAVSIIAAVFLSLSVAAFQPAPEQSAAASARAQPLDLTWG